MENLTSRQVYELGNMFLSLAQSIGDYRIKNYNSLTIEENKKLRESHKKTLDYSDDLFVMSATLVMREAESSLLQINDITKEIERLYKSLQNVQKGINLATSILTLGASVFSLNPQAIVDSIGKLNDIIES